MKTKCLILIITIVLLQSSLSAQYFGSYEFVPITGVPHDLAYDAKRNLVYVSSGASDSVDVVNPDTLQVQNSIPVGNNPMGMAITPDSNQLLVTLYDDEKMDVVDLISQMKIQTIDLPAGSGYYKPLRVDFDAKGTCIWREGGGANPYGFGYILNLTNGVSTPLPSNQPYMRYGLNMNKSKFILIVHPEGVSIWDAQTQSYSLPESLVGYGFGWDWWNWPLEGTVNNDGDTILICRTSQETWIFDEELNEKGMLDIGTGWGTFGPWDSYAIITQCSGSSSNKISLLDTNEVEIIDTLELSEKIGIDDDLDYGLKTIEMTPDGKKLFAVGQTGLFIIDTSGITEEEPISLEIEGPTEIFENTSVSFCAIGTTESGMTRDVTASASWSLEPASAGTIFNGLLEAGDVEKDLHVTITAEYISQEVQLQADKNAIIFGICPSGYALSFDGIDDYVDLPDGFADFTTGYTFTFWAFPTFPGFGSTFIELGNGRDSDNILLERKFATNDFMLDIRYGSSGDWIFVPDMIQLNKWQYFAVTQDPNGTIKFYKNGELVQTSQGLILKNLTRTENYIGKNSWPESENYQGLIDEFSIYTRPLSQDEIKQTMHVPLTGSELGLISYWDFDEGGDQIVQDLSGNGNNGFLGDDPNNPDSADPMWVESDAPIGICSSYLIAKNLIEKAIKAKKAILSEFKKQLENENTAIDALNEMLDNKEFDIVNRQEIIDTKNNIHSAIQTEKLCALQLNKSIEKLIEAMLNLAPDSADNLHKDQSIFDDDTTTTGNVSYLLIEPDADITGDGKVDFEDLAILCNQWTD